jgi:hypothetical protein
VSEVVLRRKTKYGSTRSAGYLIRPVVDLA